MQLSLAHAPVSWSAQDRSPGFQKAALQPGLRFEEVHPSSGKMLEVTQVIHPDAETTLIKAVPVFRQADGTDVKVPHLYTLKFDDAFQANYRPAPAQPKGDQLTLSKAARRSVPEAAADEIYLSAITEHPDKGEIRLHFSESPPAGKAPAPQPLAARLRRFFLPETAEKQFPV